MIEGISEAHTGAQDHLALTLLRESMKCGPNGAGIWCEHSAGYAKLITQISTLADRLQRAQEGVGVSFAGRSFA